MHHPSEMSESKGLFVDAVPVGLGGSKSWKLSENCKKAKKLKIDQILIVSEKLLSLTALSLFIILIICFGVMFDLISYDLHQNSKIE